MLALMMLLVAAGPPGKAEFLEGSKLFEAGRYVEACPRLRAAYEKSEHRPSTIRALAQCERALGHRAEAIALFREYLETKPAEAEAVRNTIAMIEGQVEVVTPIDTTDEDPIVAAVPPDRPHLAATETTTFEPIPEAAPWYASPWLWISIGIVAAAGATTGVLLATRGSPDPIDGSTGVLLKGLSAPGP